MLKGMHYILHFSSAFFPLICRIFLGVLPSETALRESTIHQRLRADNKLGDFKKLKEKDFNWRSRETFVSSSQPTETCDLITFTSVSPPAKKPRTSVN